MKLKFIGINNTVKSKVIPYKKRFTIKYIHSKLNNNHKIA